MPAFKLPNPLRRDPARPSLKARAAALRASAARVIARRPAETAEPDDPFEGRTDPPGFVPSPDVPRVLMAEGERLLGLAEAELQRRMAERTDGNEDERRSRETRLRRSLRIDALRVLAGRMDPPSRLLPEPGSEAALAAFHAACSAADRLMREPVLGYPELRGKDGSTWSKAGLDRAREAGTIALAEYARLYPLALEREHRIDTALVATNLGVLHALASAHERQGGDA